MLWDCAFLNVSYHRLPLLPYTGSTQLPRSLSYYAYGEVKKLKLCSCSDCTYRSIWLYQHNFMSSEKSLSILYSLKRAHLWMISAVWNQVLRLHITLINKPCQKSLWNLRHQSEHNFHFARICLRFNYLIFLQFRHRWKK